MAASRSCGSRATCSGRHASRWARASCRGTTTAPGRASSARGHEPRRDARPRPPQLGRVGARARLRVSDPEPAFRHLQAQGTEGAGARRRGDRRPDPRPRRARRAHRADAERPRGDGPQGGAQAAPRAVARPVGQVAATQTPAKVPCAHAADRAVPAGRGGRLQRLLHRHPPCDQYRPPAAPRQSAAAELQMGADRLSRPRLVDRRLGNGRAPSPRTAQGARCARARLCAEPTPRLRGGARLHRRQRQPPRPHDPGRRSAGARVRRGAAQRLVGARYPGVGVPASRPFPRQELRHHDLAVDRDDGRARALPLPGFCARRRRSAAAPLPARRSRSARRRARHRGGDAPAHAEDESLRSPLPQRLSRLVLDARADRLPPDFQRLQPAARRSARLGHPLGHERRFARLADGAQPRRQEPAAARERRDAHLSRRWRRGHPAWPLRARGLRHHPLRQPEAVSDRITTFFAGLRVDRAYAQQRLLLDITSTAYRYDRLSYLDFDALNYSGLWAWRLGRGWNGTIGAERTESLVNYSEFGDPTQRNVLIQQREFASAEHWLGGGWHVRGGRERLQQKYSVPFPQRGNYEAGGADAGIEYVARSTSTAALKFRALDGQFDRPLDPVARLDDGFKRIESELSLIWVATARSTFDLRAGWLDYRSNHFAERDVSGPVGAAAYRWTPAARLDLSLRASRALEPWADQNASYRAVDRRGLEARWQIAARTGLRFAFERQDADYRTPLPEFTGPARFDSLRSAQLALEWRARRNIVLDASLQRQRQSSSDPAARFEARVASLAASIRF